MDNNVLSEEFSEIPQISSKIDELPDGAESKNRYANVIPLPETRVLLNIINNDPLSEYINASYVRVSILFYHSIKILHDGIYFAIKNFALLQFFFFFLGSQKRKQILHCLSSSLRKYSL